MITKEEEEELTTRVEYGRVYGEYVCDECGDRLTGMDAVSKHVDENHHYSYSQPGLPGKLGIL